MRRLLLPVASMLLVGACGGADPQESADGGGGDAMTPAATAASGGGGGSSGSVVNPQPPGQGAASVDGVEQTFTTPGGVACRTSAEEWSFSYIIGDNEVTMGGGASIQGGQWFGSLSMRVVTDDGTTEYAAKINDNPDAVAVDGNSVSYSGPMVKYLPAAPGELPKPIDVASSARPAADDPAEPGAAQCRCHANATQSRSARLLPSPDGRRHCARRRVPLTGPT
jgi:hypothetical protein